MPLPVQIEAGLLARVLAVFPADGGGWLFELDLAGKIVPARSPLPLPVGARLVLQPLSPDRVQVAQVTMPSANSQLLASVLRTMLPVQLPIRQTYTKLATIVRDSSLPAALARNLQELLAHVPAVQQLISGAGLRKAMLDSGGFFEARLGQLVKTQTEQAQRDLAVARDGKPGGGLAVLREASSRGVHELLATLRVLLGGKPSAPAPTSVNANRHDASPATARLATAVLTNDLKARLLAVLGELGSGDNGPLTTRISVNASGSSASPALFLYGPIGRPSTPTPRLQEGIVKQDELMPSQAPVRTPPDKARDSRQSMEPLAQIRQLIQATLANTRVHQIASHPDNPQANENPPLQSWSAVLPITNEEGYDTLELLVENHAAPDNASDSPHREWRLQLCLQIETLGTLHAQLILSGDRLATTLWFDDSQTFARANAALDELGNSLRAQGIELTRLECLTGFPPRMRTTTSLIELRG